MYTYIRKLFCCGVSYVCQLDAELCPERAEVAVPVQDVPGAQRVVVLRGQIHLR